MGVLHHLVDPHAGMRRLAERLKPDGVLFVYVYGGRGSRERLRRKELLALLAGPGADTVERRIALAKSLGFGANDFGWNLNADDATSADALLVDSYANARETVFETDDLLRLLEAGGLAGFLTYGVTCGAQGLLFDTALDSPALPLPWTDLTTHLPGEDVRGAYEAMSLRDQYRLIELAYEPNGFTVLGFAEGARDRLMRVPRIRRNMFAGTRRDAGAGMAGAHVQ
jgi:SAM-dependent methyltransferase